MEAQEKLDYVIKRIDELFFTNPSGEVMYYTYTVTHPDNEEWTILSAGEQKNILKKLEEDGYIKNLKQDSEEKRRFFIEKGEKYTEIKNEERKVRSNLYRHIQSIDDLLENRELTERALKMLGEVSSMKAGSIYGSSTYEKDDDIVQLLINLGVVEYDWNDIENQTHRQVGNRIIEFKCNGTLISGIVDRIKGRNGRIRKDALELVARDIGERFSLSKIVDMFNDIGVPESMFIQDTKWRAVFYILSFYANSVEDEKRGVFLKILEKFIHPLSFEGDENQASTQQELYSSYLKYDNVVFQNYKAFLGPTKEEWEAGVTTIIDSTGKENYPIIEGLQQENKEEVDALLDKAKLIREFNKYDISNLSLNEKIYFVKVLYSYFETILRTYYGSGMFFVSSGIDDLNDYFKVLKRKIEKVLASDNRFEELTSSGYYQSVFETVSGLYSSTEFLDVIWEDSVRPSLLNIREDIADLDLFDNESEIHKVPVPIFNFLKVVGDETNKLKELLRKQNIVYDEQMKKTAEKIRVNMGFDKDSKESVRHEHTHSVRFENNIQESPVDLNIFGTQEITQSEPVKLSDFEISYDDEVQTLKIGDYKTVQFPAYTNQHYVVRVLFSRAKGEAVDWQNIYESMAGNKSDTLNKKEIEAQKRSVKDAVRAVNKRVQEVVNTECELIKWGQKTAQRNY
ncbi:hypothetical protein H6776_02740 [Candidatus Nomurabacteria bacterium]|nr:hypothetical protein [Candidatus Nomurabacteria bacterium]